MKNPEYFSSGVGSIIEFSNSESVDSPVILTSYCVRPEIFEKDGKLTNSFDGISNSRKSWNLTREKKPDETGLARYNSCTCFLHPAYTSPLALSFAL